MRPAIGKRRAAAAAVVAVVALLAGALSLTVHGSQTPASRQAALRSVTIAMGYVPDIQFAPYYVALSRGYYRAAGLDIHFNYNIEPTLLKLADQGKVDFVVSGGDEVLAAGAHGLRVTYVMTQYSTFPSALFALQSAGITSPARLRNKTVGIPGQYGASYVGLLTLLHAGGLSTANLSLKSIGYTQAASVAARKVDAAVGYAMNEPLELRSEGYKVSELDIWHWANIAGAGIAAGNSMIANHPAVVRAFVQATLHGLRDTIRSPSAAYAISARIIHLKSNDPLQRAKLQRSIAFWRAEPGHPLGWVDPTIWHNSVDLLYRFKQLPARVSATRFYTNRFVG